MTLRLRLFDDDSMSAGIENIEADFEALLTPTRKGLIGHADTPLSIEIPARKILKPKTCFDVKRSLFSGKRQADWEDSSSVLSTKRSRISEETAVTLNQTDNTSNKINDVIEKLESLHTIADGSRAYTFPTVRGKHGDLKSITSETMSEVLRGDYDSVCHDITIVDCRYPYEYDGGHIRGAINLYTKDAIYALLQKPVTSEKPHVLIFHCEFSSERGPKMYRFLRAQDRELHRDQYPKLNYPEVYLLDGGYKEFYNKHQSLCEPINYKPMLHEDHHADLRYFRAKSKSWTTSDQQVYCSRRHRSRLSRHISF